MTLWVLRSALVAWACEGAARADGMSSANTTASQPDTRRSVTSTKLEVSGRVLAMSLLSQTPTTGVPAGRFQEVGLKPRTLHRLSAAVSVSEEPMGPMVDEGSPLGPIVRLSMLPSPS